MAGSCVRGRAAGGQERGLGQRVVGVEWPEQGSGGGPSAGVESVFGHCFQSQGLNVGWPFQLRIMVLWVFDKHFVLHCHVPLQVLHLCQAKE